MRVEANTRIFWLGEAVRAGRPSVQPVRRPAVRFGGCKVTRPQYFDLMAYVSPMVNWNEFGLVGGVDEVAPNGASFK